MHDAIVEKLYSEYIANGFISEDRVFDIVQAEGVPLFDIEYICDQLLARGVIIRDENNSDDDEEIELNDQTQTDYRTVYTEITNLDEGLNDLVEYIKSIQPPQRREWQNLLPQAQSGNMFARNRIFEMYMRVAAKIALQYSKRYYLPIADTLQDALYGLLLSIDKFEYGKQDHFTTYFPFWIRQVILREAQTPWANFYFPAHFKDSVFEVFEIDSAHSCSKCNWSEPCPGLINEIEHKIPCDNNQAKALWLFTRPSLCLEEIIADEIENDHDNEEVPLSDKGEFEQRLVEANETNQVSYIIKSRLKHLTEREAKVINLRYGLLDGNARTLEEVGNEINVTRERVRQIEQKALRKLKKYLTSFSEERKKR